MRGLFIILFAFAGVFSTPSGKPEVPAVHPGEMTSAELNVSVEIPEAIMPALHDALTHHYYGTTGARLADIAKRYLGCRYVWGSCGPDRFDCSGLTSWVYGLEGISLSRSSREQYRVGVEVKPEDFQPGDLIFFSHDNTAASIYHVGMVVDADGKGNYHFIHSTRTGVRVSTSREQAFARDYFGARRVLANADLDALIAMATTEATEAVEVAKEG